MSHHLQTLRTLSTRVIPVPLRHHKPHHVINTALFVMLSAATIGGLYLAMNDTASLARVQTGSIMVSGKSTDEIRAQLTSAAQTYEFGITDESGKTTYYHAADAGLDYDIEKTIASIEESQKTAPLLARLSWWQTNSLPIVVTKDEQKLTSFIQEKFIHVTAKPTNATLTINDDGLLTTAVDIPGSAFTIYQPTETLVHDFATLNGRTYTLTAMPIPAAVRTSDIDAVTQKARTIMQQSVRFTIKDRQFAVPAKTIATWVEPINAQATTARFELNSGKIMNYIDSIAADFVDLPVNQVAISRGDGSTVVLAEGKNGTDIKDKKSIATSVADQLAQNKPVNQSLVVAEAPYATVSAFNYDKWLLVDLTNKKMDAYEKDVMVKSFPVSAGAPATPTVTGQYKIYLKTRAQDMRGANVDGSSYFQPNVEWNSFFYGSMAIHGNYWRPESWFGNYNSSHGCVGLPNRNAQWIYEWAPIGTPVIIHW